MSALKENVRGFFDLVVKGEIDKAYDLFVSPSMKHHNAYYKGDCETLKQGMKDNQKQFPNKQFEVKKILEEENTVCTFSLVKHRPEDRGVAVMHMFRFEGGKIVEMWDMGAPLPESSPNENGMF